MTRMGLKGRLALGHGIAIAVILAGATLVADRVLSHSVMSQLDAALLALADTEAASELDEPGGGIHLHPVTSEVGGPSLRPLDKLVQDIGPDGTVLQRSETLGTASLPVSAELLDRLRAREIVMQTIPKLAGEPVRMVSFPIFDKGELRYAVQVAIPLRTTLEFLRTARLLFAGGSLAILCAVAGIGLLLTRAALRPIDRVVAQARRIGEANLQERLPDPDTPDEVGRLIRTLNEMLGRIERAFETQRRFTADASHELRSPLSRLRSELEVTLRRRRDSTEYEEVLRSALEEVERLSRLTEALLTLAHLDAGEIPASAPSVALAPLVEAETRRLKPEADRRNVGLRLDIPPSLAVVASPEALGVVLANLIQNAVKFSPPGGQVTIAGRRDDGMAVLAVSDKGDGIPPADLPRLFERFFRGTPGRSPDVPGFGLGLAIARTIMRAHRGTLEAESRPGEGATFTVRLPLATGS